MGMWGFSSICAVMIGSYLMFLIFMQQKKEIKILEIEELKLSRDNHEEPLD